MNILYFGNALSGRGRTPTTIETLSKLLEQDHEVKVSSHVRNKILRFVDMKWTLIRNLKWADVVLIDVYSSVAFYYASWLSVICRMFNLPYTTIAHGGNLPVRLKKSPKSCHRLFDNAFAVITPSDYLKNALDDFGVSSKIIRNPVDMSLYPFAEWNPNGNILWVRSLASIYNPEMAVKTLAELHKSGLNVRLTMVGPEKDVEIAQLKKVAGEQGVENYVEFTGLLTKQQWISRAATHSFFINTTHVDNTPVSVIEAMALGLVVVSTNVGGIPFLIDNDVNGFTIPDNDYMAMAAKISELMNDADHSKVERVRKNAYKLALEFDSKTVLTDWNSTLKHVNSQ